MFYSSLPVIFTGLTALVLASPWLEKRTTFTGVATFNDFIEQVRVLESREMALLIFFREELFVAT